jgi:cytidine deaminase
VNDEELGDLLAAAREIRGRAYVPYSGFQVGAAILAEEQVFTAVNVENASYPLSVCAERNAVAAMVAAGRRRLQAVAVVTDAERPTPPCGGCRQVLAEFGIDAVVVSETLGGVRARWTVSELLPEPFVFER